MDEPTNVKSAKNVRQTLKQEALANAGRDLEMAAEWFPLEQEVLPQTPATARKLPHQR